MLINRDFCAQVNSNNVMHIESQNNWTSTHAQRTVADAMRVAEGYAIQQLPDVHTGEILVGTLVDFYPERCDAKHMTQESARETCAGEGTQRNKDEESDSDVHRDSTHTGIQ